MTKQEYDAERFAAYLEALLKAHNQSYRHASLQAGLDAGAVRRYVKLGTQPLIASCIALAEHFGISPNEMLIAAGHDPLVVLDPSLVDPTALPPEVGEVALVLAQMPDPGRRRRLCSLVHEMVDLSLAS